MVTTIRTCTTHTFPDRSSIDNPMPRTNTRLGQLNLLAAHCLLLIVSSSGSSLIAQEAPVASPSTWISAQGKAIEASFVRLEADSVVLKLNSNGKEANVPLSSLSLESHLQALKLANPDAFSKPLVKANQPAAIEPFTPAISISSSEILVSPFGPNPSIESFLETIKKEIERGNIFVSWHTLPPRMQNDIETIIEKTMGSVTPQQMVQLRTLFKSLQTIVIDKQHFILGHPAMAEAPEIADGLQMYMPQVVYFVESVLAEDNWRVENFKKGKIVPWLAEMSSRVAPIAHNIILSQLAEQDGNFMNYRIVSQSAESADVEFSSAGPTATQRMVKFENIWIIPEQMTQLREQVNVGLKQVENGIDTSALSIGLLGLNAIAGKLARAESQAEFNAAVDDLQELPGASMAVSALQMQAATGGMPAGAMGAPPASASGNRGGGPTAGNPGGGPSSSAPRPKVGGAPGMGGGAGSFSPDN
jgi:hypothetical protein